MASNQPLVDRTEAVYRELRSMRLRFRLGAWITLIVGGLLLMLVTVYFSYGYSEVSSFRDPELIVSLVGDMADQQIPTMRKLAQDQVDQNATAWAEMASEQVLTQVGPIREQIETLALQQSDEAIAKINVIGEKKFREILAQNRDTVQDAIDQLKDNQDVSEGAVIALQEAIEKEFLIDADSQVDALVTIVSDTNANMEELVTGENLSREQRAERRVLMLARRLHVDRFGDMSVKDISDSIAPSVVGDLVEEAETQRLRNQAEEASADAADEMAAVDTAVAEKPEEKKEAPAEEKPADKPKEEAKPAEKADAPAKEAKPAAKPEEKKEAPAKEKPADEPKEEAKPAEKPEEKKEAS